mmetsp:Transcript_61427/g.171729  ORF Transcript_61427/g.171729 Transcript_61427/m.171729 type:complete len:946 (+) Transcript_61427:96-2933(+)
MDTCTNTVASCAKKVAKAGVALLGWVPKDFGEAGSARSSLSVDPALGTLLGRPLDAFAACHPEVVPIVEKLRLEYASFRLGAARGVKGELSLEEQKMREMVRFEEVRSQQAPAPVALEEGSAVVTESPPAPPPAPLPTSAVRSRAKPRQPPMKSQLVGHLASCQCARDDDLYHATPPASFADRRVKVPYIHLPSVATGGDPSMLEAILRETPRPKGRTEFSSVHVVAPPEQLASKAAEPLVARLEANARAMRMGLCVHRLPPSIAAAQVSALEEYEAIFETASSVILSKADRASLLLFVGWEDVSKDAFAAFIGMLPFRGIPVALLSQRTSAGDLLRQVTPSGVFEVDGRDAGRMGMFPVSAVFGPLPSGAQEANVDVWEPVHCPVDEDSAAVRLPFKIGGLELPMITHNAAYDDALGALASALSAHYSAEGGFFPIVSCGETCDALGYGLDVMQSLDEPGYYFAHRSGETFKRYDNYGSTGLFESIASAKAMGRRPVIIAVGGGVNGNSIGLVAAITGSDFIEVPTTPMHFNDATTSAKKAFSLVVDDRILSKNILGAFYLPRLVFCVNEMLLSCSSANIHATVGESTKTMNMLGVASSVVGAGDYHNILGACEFASDTTKIVQTVGGFNRLVTFIESPAVANAKAEVVALGQRIAMLREAGQHGDNDFEAMLELRRTMMSGLRDQFHVLGSEDRESIKDFLTVINREIVAAKAMFLAYSDPFEKYRALLFEYAHTLGHGVEAFANGLYAQCRARGVDVPERALRLHGQCVGMAVLWAGQMSADLGALQGDGLLLHQSLVYLFNRHGGFSFRPLRELCDAMGVDQEAFCEGVLAVVRRDNKRGYVASADPIKSVDQLVAERPGRMLRSDDSNAELRYLVEVDEDWQRKVLCQAFDGHFDKVADMRGGRLTFVPSDQLCESEAESVAAAIYASLTDVFVPPRSAI